MPGAFHGPVPGLVWQEEESHSPWTDLRGPRQFTIAPEAQLLADRWRLGYNTSRLHSSLQGSTTPLEAAQLGAAA